MQVKRSYYDFIENEVKKKNALLIGCCGRTDIGQAATFEKVTKKWYGFDINKKFMAKNPQYNIYYIDLNNDWQHPIEDVEIVVLSEVLEHLESPIRALRNLKKNFPGRRLLITVPNGCSIGKLILTILKHPELSEQDWDHLLLYNKRTLSNALKTANINDLKFMAYETHWYFFPLVKIFPNLSQGFIVDVIL